MIRGAALAALVVLLAVPAGVPAADPGDRGVVVTVTYDASAGDDREVGLVARFAPGADVTALRYSIPRDATVVSTTGFRRVAEGTLRWDGATDGPRLRLRLRPAARTGPVAQYFGIATDDWALFTDRRRTSVRTRGTDGWQGPRTDAVDRRVRTAGEGFVGARTVYLGRHTVTGRTVAGTRLRVVEPAGGMAADRERALDRLAFAARHLDVGAADRDVTVIVGPTPIYAGFVAGANRTAVDLVVSARERPRGPSDVWLHEYVHARQNWSLAPSARWLTEGSANYYAALLDLHRTGNYGAFRATVTTGADADAVLATDVATDAEPAYSKGMRVAAALDAEIRARSGGSATLADVLRRVNAHEGTVGHADLVRFASAAAGSDMTAWLDRYVYGPATPTVPADPTRFAATTPGVDSDGDGLDDVVERDRRTDPFAVDSDGDGSDDAAEAARETDPLAADTDGDGLDDGREAAVGSDPLAVDTDGDGLDDARELAADADPTATDTDGDGLDDAREVALGTDPAATDTDDDGLADDAELAAGADPLTTDSDGDGTADGADVAPTDAARQTPTPTAGTGPGLGVPAGLAGLAGGAAWLTRRRG